MQSYYTTIPTYITTRNDLSDGTKIFYGTVQSLCGKYGFCWASNQTLAKISHKTTRQVQRYIEKLKHVGLLFVEIEYKNERKIWTKETWPNRDELKKSFDQDLAFNQRFDRYDMDVMGGTTWMSPNKYNDINISKEKVGKKGGMGENNQPRQASAPTSFSKKENQKYRPPPPTEKSTSEKVSKAEKKNPSKISLTLSADDHKRLCEIIPDSTIRQKYIDNAIKFVKKMHHNAYNGMSLFDIIVKFYREDQENQLNSKNEIRNKRCLEGLATIEKIMRENPKLTSGWEIEKNYVIVARSPSSGDICINFDNHELDKELNKRLQLMKEYFEIKESNGKEKR